MGCRKSYKMTEIITITKNDGTREDIDTDGYILLYLEGDKIVATGNIGLKALAPIIMKYTMEKLSK